MDQEDRKAFDRIIGKLEKENSNKETLKLLRKAVNYLVITVQDKHCGSDDILIDEINKYLDKYKNNV